MLHAPKLLKFFSRGFLILAFICPMGIASAGNQPVRQMLLPAGKAQEILGDAAYNPILDVWLGVRGFHVDGGDWTVGDTITLTVDDPGTAPSPDYTASAIAQPASWDATSGRVVFVLDGIIEIKPGFTVTLSDGTVTKTLVEPLIEVTVINPLQDTVAGTATAGARVAVSPYDDNNARRYATASASGDWVVDFSTPGSELDEQTLFDIQFGNWGNATIYDGDGDSTAYEWQAATSFYVFFANWGNPNNGISFDVHGYKWPLNTPVTMTVDKLETELSPDYTRIAYMEVQDWGGNPQLVFDTAGMIVHTGDLITVTDGKMTISHTITALTITEFNVDTDTVSGTAGPNSVVDLNLRSVPGTRHVTTGSNGNWLADFSEVGDEADEQNIVDLVPGSDFFISQNNPGNKGATNAYGINIPNPYIEAAPVNNWIRAWNWPPGTVLTLLVDDPNTAQPVDYSATDVAANEGPCENPDCTIGFFPLEGFDLQAGHIITIMHGTKVRSYTAQSLRITRFDFDANTISGKGVIAHQLRMCIDTPDPQVCRTMTVNGAGNWWADLQNPGANPDEQETYDLQPGSSGQVTDGEANGDRTVVRWLALAKIFLPQIVR